VVVSSANRRRRTLLGAFVATAIVTTLILSRVIATVFFAITVGYVLFPIRQRLVNLGRRRRVAAATATLIGLLAGLITVVPIFAALYIRRTVFLEFIRGLPPEVPVEAFGFAYVIDVGVVFQFIQRGLTSIAVSSARAAPVIGLKAALFVFLVYALLLRPHEIRAALLELVPPSYHDVTLSFHKRIRSTLYAIYVLQAATAFGTFLIAYVVFTALGYQSAFTLAVFAGLLQFIPVVGPSVVVIALGAYQLAIGQSTAAILVVVLGLVLVGFLPDALIRPRLASFTAGMPGSLYFVGFIGGVLTVGIIGFIAGPLAVAVLIEAADQLTEEVGVEPVKEG
jgi:predicted PurR-regulated permease PerM